MPKRTVTVDEAAAMLRVSRRTVYYMVQRGQLHLISSGTSSAPHRRIDTSEIEQLAASRLTARQASCYDDSAGTGDTEED
jgi:excisionase family DNA binding protein